MFQETTHHHVPQHKDYRPDVSQPGEAQESEYDNEPDDDQGGKYTSVIYKNLVQILVQS